jgi:hypothetical protein
MFDFPFFKIRLFVFVVGFLAIMMFMGMCRDAHAQCYSASSVSSGSEVFLFNTDSKVKVCSILITMSNPNLPAGVNDALVSCGSNNYVFVLASSSIVHGYFYNGGGFTDRRWSYGVCDDEGDTGGGDGGGSGGDTGDGDGDGGSGGGDLPSPDIPNESMPSGWGSDGAAVTIDTYSFGSLFSGFVEKTRALPIFASFSFGNPDTSFGDAYLEFDLGELGGLQEFDFHVWDGSLSVVGSLLVIVTAVIAIRVVFLKG